MTVLRWFSGIAQPYLEYQGADARKNIAREVFNVVLGRFAKQVKLDGEKGAVSCVPSFYDVGYNHHHKAEFTFEEKEDEDVAVAPFTIHRNTSCLKQGQGG